MTRLTHAVRWRLIGSTLTPMAVEAAPYARSRRAAVIAAVNELLDEQQAYLDAARHPLKIDITLEIRRGGGFSIHEPRMAVQVAGKRG